MKYPVAERFKSLQGEGVYTGTPMAFIRLVGCSVGQNICKACDTDFSRMIPELGGGLYSADELIEWVGDYQHVCITGGEPLDRDLTELQERICVGSRMMHIETSGTKMNPILMDRDPREVWVCVSPKPGYDASIVRNADEIKVIYPGLGPGPGWPTVDDALSWADDGVPVFLQPCNFKNQPDEVMVMEVVQIVEKNPSLRLSVQLHKILNKR